MSQAVWTVSQLMSSLKDLVEPAFENLTVEGEVSGLRPNTSGHLYFTLKDDTAQVDCALFSYQRSKITIEIKNGDQVQVKGRLSIYEMRGKITFIVQHIIPLGLGNVLMRLEELKRRLAAEGLFDSRRKRSLPSFPQRIALITSPTGAALQDMLRVFRQRGAWAQVLVVGAAVQGEDAPAQLVQALRYVNRWELADVIIIGRGGGSFEDLLPFSDEAVVRAVSESRIPVVSAVGHEIDNPLCDLAADVAAPTPTAAAALVWPHFRDDWLHRIIEHRTHLQHEIQRRFEETERLLRPFRAENLAITIEQILDPVRSRLTWLREELPAAIKQVLHTARLNLTRLQEGLQAHSPLDVLRRGYAIVQTDAGILRRAAEAPIGTALTIQLHEGRISATSQGERS